jgi:predicted porin
MKLKTSAIAMAVAGTLATPMAAQADVYASVRIGVENLDTGGVSDMRTRSFGSRFGIRSETDLGNGMTAFGRYEWDVDFSDHNEDADDDIDIRHRYVGMKGDFGSLTIGQTYHTYYNHIIGPTDQPWWGAGYTMINYSGREDGAVTYAGSFGAVSVGLSGYFFREAEEDAPDQIEAAISFGIGDMTLGIGVQTVADDGVQGSTGDDEAITGVTLHGIALGDATLAVNFEAQDDDTSVAADLGVGNFRFHIEQLSDDSADTDPNFVMVGYTQNLGRGTALWYEYGSYDADSGDSDDDSDVLRAVLKYDIM